MEGIAITASCCSCSLGRNTVVFADLASAHLNQVAQIFGFFELPGQV